MEIEDINKSIGLQINDFQSLVNYCNLNKKTREICSDKSFWYIIFKEWGLNLPEHLPTSPEEWLNTLYATYNMNLILDKLHGIIQDNNIIITNYSNSYIINVNNNFKYDYYLKLYQNITTNHNRVALKTPINFIIKNLKIIYHKMGFLIGKYIVELNIEVYYNDGFPNVIKQNALILSETEFVSFLYNIIYDHAVYI
jgi:hypothetical protein